jgi:hypothetical protein
VFVTKGDATEAQVLAALVRLGHRVLLPFSSAVAYDLAVDLDGRLIRVQCKTAWPRGDCLVFNSCSTDHGRGREDYRDRADVFGVACPGDDRVFIVPVHVAATRATSLRLVAPRNGQRIGVHLAEDFLAERWRPSALAA